MIEQGTPFTWYFKDEQRKGLSIFRLPVCGSYSLRRIHKDGNHWWNENLSSHETLEEAIAASELLLELAK